MYCVFFYLALHYVIKIKTCSSIINEHNVTRLVDSLRWIQSFSHSWCALLASNYSSTNIYILCVSSVFYLYGPTHTVTHRHRFLSAAKIIAKLLPSSPAPPPPAAPPSFLYTPRPGTYTVPWNPRVVLVDPSNIYLKLCCQIATQLFIFANVACCTIRSKK